MAFEVGNHVRRRATGEVGVVLDLDGQQYCTVSLPSGVHIIPLEELELYAGDALSALLQRRIEESELFSLRLQAELLRHAYRFDPRSGLSNARIEPQLHQIYVAHRVANKLRPRMVLADEVGLGKTIEAGLIVKELLARKVIDRMLVVCPASIQLQWQQELKTKFNEEFRIFDGPAVRYLGRDGSNPWEKENRIICSLPLAARPKNAERIASATWDMVIFDEAHKVRRTWQGKSKYKTTQAYALADELKEGAFGVLLLTATPMQLHPFELYSLLELVEPGLFGSFAQYEQRRRELPRLNELMKLLQSWEKWLPEERSNMVRHYLPILNSVSDRASSLNALDDAKVRNDVATALIARHPLAECLVRNRKTEVGGFTTREAHRLNVTLSEEEQALYEDVTRYTRGGIRWAEETKNQMFGFLMVTYQKMFTSSSQALRTSLGRRVVKLKAEGQPSSQRTALSRPATEDLEDPMELSTVTGLVDDLVWQSPASEVTFLEQLIERLRRVRDSKADVFVNDVVAPVFAVQPNDKLLVFTQFTETQDYLARVLQHFGYSVSIFNGAMSIDEKEAAVLRFKKDTQILISTEAGGEGRNLQFCHQMVNYDLPWNPMRVEQRIGRLDRIGQSQAVVIYNLASLGTIEERVLEVLDTRIHLFEESVGSLDPILGEVEKQFESLVTGGGGADAAFTRWEEDLEHRVRDARERERTMQDFVLDHASFRRDEANLLLNRPPFANHLDLAGYIGRALTYYGGTLEPHAGGGIEIALSPRLSAQLNVRPVHRGVFDPDIARRDEELEFFAFGHPLVEKLVDLPQSDHPLTGCRVVDDVDEPVALEVYYEIRGEGVRTSSTIIRHRVDPTGKVSSVAMRSLAAAGEPHQLSEWPVWLGEAAEQSRRRAQAELQTERVAMKQADDTLREQDLERAHRVVEYRRVRLKTQMEQQASLIAAKEGSSSERERRILPALRGKLTKLRGDLERLEFEHQRDVLAITSRELGVALRVLAAGIVVRQ